MKMYFIISSLFLVVNVVARVPHRPPIPSMMKEWMRDFSTDDHYFSKGSHAYGVEREFANEEEHRDILDVPDGCRSNPCVDGSTCELAEENPFFVCWCSDGTYSIDCGEQERRTRKTQKGPKEKQQKSANSTRQSPDSPNSSSPSPPPVEYQTPTNTAQIGISNRNDNILNGVSATVEPKLEPLNPASTPQNSEELIKLSKDIAHKMIDTTTIEPRIPPAQQSPPKSDNPVPPNIKLSNTNSPTAAEEITKPIGIAENEQKKSEFPNDSNLINSLIAQPVKQPAANGMPSPGEINLNSKNNLNQIKPKLGPGRKRPSQRLPKLAKLVNKADSQTLDYANYDEYDDYAPDTRDNAKIDVFEKEFFSGNYWKDLRNGEDYVPRYKLASKRFRARTSKFRRPTNRQSQDYEEYDDVDGRQRIISKRQNYYRPYHQSHFGRRRRLRPGFARRPYWKHPAWKRRYWNRARIQQPQFKTTDINDLVLDFDEHDDDDNWYSKRRARNLEAEMDINRVPVSLNQANSGAARLQNLADKSQKLHVITKRASRWDKAPASDVSPSDPPPEQAQQWQDDFKSDDDEFSKGAGAYRGVTAAEREANEDLMGPDINEQDNSQTPKRWRDVGHSHTWKDQPDAFVDFDVTKMGCIDFHCNYHGFCEQNEKTGEPSCNCSGGYRGNSCEQHPCLGEDLSALCNDRGLCIPPGIFEFKPARCGCIRPAKGKYCNQTMTTCELYPDICQHGGKCEDKEDGKKTTITTTTETSLNDLLGGQLGLLDPLQNYTCRCTGNYTGQDCDRLPQIILPPKPGRDTRMLFFVLFLVIIIILIVAVCLSFCCSTECWRNDTGNGAFVAAGTQYRKGDDPYQDQKVASLTSLRAFRGSDSAVHSDQTPPSDITTVSSITPPMLNSQQAIIENEMLKAMRLYETNTDPTQHSVGVASQDWTLKTALDISHDRKQKMSVRTNSTGNETDELQYQSDDTSMTQNDRHSFDVNAIPKDSDTRSDKFGKMPSDRAEKLTLRSDTSPISAGKMTSTSRNPSIVPENEKSTQVESHELEAIRHHRERNARMMNKELKVHPKFNKYRTKSVNQKKATKETRNNSSQFKTLPKKVIGREKKGVGHKVDAPKLKFGAKVFKGPKAKRNPLAGGASHRSLIGCSVGSEIDSISSVPHTSFDISKSETTRYSTNTSTEDSENVEVWTHKGPSRERPKKFKTKEMQESILTIKQKHMRLALIQQPTGSMAFVKKGHVTNIAGVNDAIRARCGYPHTIALESSAGSSPAQSARTNKGSNGTDATTNASNASTVTNNRSIQNTSSVLSQVNDDDTVVHNERLVNAHFLDNPITVVREAETGRNSSSSTTSTYEKSK